MGKCAVNGSLLPGRAGDAESAEPQALQGGSVSQSQASVWVGLRFSQGWV
jgi:hypothetical protein